MNGQEVREAIAHGGDEAVAKFVGDDVSVELAID